MCLAVEVQSLTQWTSRDVSIKFLKVTFHLQLVENIGYIPHVVQRILESALHPTVCASHLPPLCSPSTPLANTSLSIICESASLVLLLH